MCVGTPLHVALLQKQCSQSAVSSRHGIESASGGRGAKPNMAGNFLPNYPRWNIQSLFKEGKIAFSIFNCAVAKRML